MRFNLSDVDYNLDALYYNIQMFEALNGREPSYAVMNWETEQLIECHSRQCIYRIGQDLWFRHRSVSEIFGIPIAHHEGLDVGVVDIV